MSCQHEWVRISKNWRDHVCSKCGMDMSVGEYEALQQARRQGWEQCQREAIIKTMEHHQDYIFGSSIPTVCRDIADAIATMEYKV